MSRCPLAPRQRRNERKTKDELTGGTNRSESCCRVRGRIILISFPLRDILGSRSSHQDRSVLGIYRSQLHILLSEKEDVTGYGTVPVPVPPRLLPHRWAIPPVADSSSGPPDGRGREDQRGDSSSGGSFPSNSSSGFISIVFTCSRTHACNMKEKHGKPLQERHF